MSNGLVVSVEVIRLLKWILERGKSELLTITTKAIATGCLEIDKKSRLDATKNLNDFQSIVLGLIAFLEKQVDNHILGTINISQSIEEVVNKLHLSKIDPTIILGSIRTTSIDFKKYSTDELLGKQEEIVKNMLGNVLKKWRPGAKDAVA